ncbi:MAG: DNA-binding response regulator [Candidatus Dadabacteria bacterium]|nr:MAG: DNA-binding response regulator [Candidatus Dadabacteria bacterium]
MATPMPRILIVDDEADLVETLARAARREGYEVDTALSGAGAWDRLATRPYDAVVTDLRMPGMGGAELMDRIVERGVRTRVVVITGYATLQAAIDCLRKGAVDFLQKPFEVETFLERLAEALAKPLPPGPPNWHEIARRHGLTERERVVVEALYRTGLGNRELADHLCVSPHTVKSQLRSAFRKLGVENRTQFLQRFVAEPAVSPPPRPAPGSPGAPGES